mmetsp:Transcript_1276/g.2258  ORF Transcript_1276/g.2258 Transcript_1276/m.2258 type:complete len:268 (-) Transcript_1276:369-1172(-)
MLQNSKQFKLRSDFLYYLNNVLILQDVVLTHCLRPMLCTDTPHQGMLEVLNHVLMDPVTEALHRPLVSWKHNRIVPVGILALWLGVDSHHVAILPNLLEQALQVPLQVATDGAVVLHLIEKLQLLQAKGVDLVHHVDARNVDSVSLDHVNELVHGRVAPKYEVRRDDSVLLADGSDGFLVDFRQRVRVDDIQAALILPSEGDVGRGLVQAHAKTFELVVNEILVGQRLGRVQHHNNDIARPRRRYDLPSPTFAVLSSFDNSRQVKHL